MYTWKRRALALLTVVGIAAGINVALASPAAAVGGWSCSGLGIGFGQDIYREGNIRIGGITYGAYRWGANGHQYRVSSLMAVDDTRADGKPPYVYLVFRYEDGHSYSTSRFHNYQSAAGGWECHSHLVEALINRIVEVNLVGGVDNAPTVPDVWLAGWRPA